VLVAE